MSDPEAVDPRRPLPPDLADLARQLHERKVNLLESASREADLRWTIGRMRRELEAAARREAAALATASEAGERAAALRQVLDAYVANIGPLGLRRRRFLARIRGEAAAIPLDGPQAVRHAALQEEVRRLLGLEGD